MTGRYKVTGIDPGETGVRLGNCLTMRRSRDVVNTPGMYEKIRGSAMGWMNSTGSLDNLVFFDELFGSDVVLNHVVPEPGQRGDAMESAVLVAALLIAFPDARFGIGLSGGEDSLGGGLYRSLGKQAVALLDGSEARDFLIPLSRLRNSWGFRLGAVLNSPGEHPFALDRRLDAGSGGPAARREVEVGLFRRVADRAPGHGWVTDAHRAPKGRCRRCAGYVTRRTSWSAVSASTPNMQ